MQTLTGAVQLVWSFIFPPVPVPVERRADSKGSLTTDEVLTRQAADLLREIGCAALAERVAVRWHARLVSTAGLARAESAEVHLNPRLPEFPGEVDRTLRHELAHLAAYDRAGKRRITAHGAEWRLACRDLGIPDENRCHTLPLGRRRPVRRGHVTNVRSARRPCAGRGPSTRAATGWRAANAVASTRADVSTGGSSS